MTNIVFRPYREGFAALDVLISALRYLAKQYSCQMTRPEAMAHFGARKILTERYFGLLDEMELEYRYEGG